MITRLFLLSLLLIPTFSSSSLVPKESEISDFETRLTLARILSHKKNTQAEALPYYEKLIREKPDKVEFYIELGQLYIALKKPDAGLNLLYQALELHPGNLDLILATAQAEASLGHAEQSRELFLKALAISCKQELKITYADAAMGWGSFYEAEQIYRDALENEPESIDLSLKLAWSLSSSARYEEAEEIYCNLPATPKVLEAKANLKLQEKKFEEALEIISLLPNEPAYILLKADTLALSAYFHEAQEAYEELLAFPEYAEKGQIGIGKVYLHLNQEDEAKNAFDRAHYLGKDMLATTPQELEVLAKLYLEDGEPEPAFDLYLDAVTNDPNYFPGWIGLAEVLSIFECYEEALEIYKCLLETFPENSKIMISISRVLGWSKHYCESIAWYDRMIAINPNDTVLYKERARTALWAHDFKTAMQTYDVLYCLTENEQIQTSTALEKQAQCEAWHHRNLHALCTYEELLELKPGDEELLFDYAQINCGLGLCCKSIEVYDDILTMDPNHSLVKRTLRSLDFKNCLTARGYFSYWREIGSGTFSQSQIARYRFDAIFEQPLSCSSHLRFIQQAFVENPFFNFKFYPAEGQAFEADGVFNEHLRGFTSISYKNYFGKFKSRVSTRNNVEYRFNDYLQARIGCDYENEIYNFFSLKQGIQALSNWVILRSDLNHYWNVEAGFQNLNYSDNNNQVHANLTTRIALTDDPLLFQIIVDGNYRNTVHDSVSITLDNELVDVIHPYWTPQAYFAGSLTVQGRYDYRNIITCESPNRYIDLKITGETDNVNNPSIQATLEWRHEYDQCGFEIKGLIHRSPLWNAEGLWASFFYHF